MGTSFKGMLTIVILAVAFLAVGFGFLTVRKKLAAVELSLGVCNRVSEVALFNQMFIKKVLISKTQMSFDERLELENTVRKLDDVEILRVWRAFTDSKNDADAQVQVKDLLKLLSNKMAVQ